MIVRELSLPGVMLLEPRVFQDERGFFTEMFNVDSLEASTIPSAFVQDNHSRSFRGVLRGLHYQLTSPQGKLVHVARGSVFDVAVDIRAGSPRFGEWCGVELNDENLHSLWIPPGFAHGFYVRSDVADVIYKCTTVYSAPDDRGIAWNDPEIGIDWPDQNPILSARDSLHPGLSANTESLPQFSP
ncbi:MAG: dTDP-4-dehydrorhamnose 3,5-epimerase [Gemmatimonadaceae bacterium]